MDAKLIPGHCAGELVVGDTKIIDSAWIKVPEKYQHLVKLHEQFGEVEVREEASKPTELQALAKAPKPRRGRGK